MKKSIVNQCMEMVKNYLPKHPQYIHRNHFIHFSFIIIHGEIVGFGINKEPPASFPKLASYPATSMVHSEVDAYFKYQGKIRKAGSFGMINIRLNRTYQIRNSQPCPHCTNFLRNVGCNDIWFSTDMGFARYI